MTIEVPSVVQGAMFLTVGAVLYGIIRAGTQIGLRARWLL